MKGGRLGRYSAEDVELFRDVDTGEALCRYFRAGHAVVNPLGSEAFLSWAACGFYEVTGSTISSALAKEAFLLLQAQAAEGKGRKTHVRAGEHDSKVYIDLCSEAFETVEITLEDWSVVTGASVYFRGSAMSKPLPRPQRDGTLDVLRSIVNFASFDPLDNCGRIHREMSGEVSGHFCRLAAGGGFTKRRLYSDNDAYAVSVTRPLVLNGIALSLGRLDLLDRAFCVELAPFARGKRRTEERVYREFRERHAQLLGALCTAVSASLREKDYCVGHGAAGGGKG